MKNNKPIICNKCKEKIKKKSDFNPLLFLGIDFEICCNKCYAKIQRTTDSFFYGPYQVNSYQTVLKNAIITIIAIIMGLIILNEILANRMMINEYTIIPAIIVITFVIWRWYNVFKAIEIEKKLND